MPGTVSQHVPRCRYNYIRANTPAPVESAEALASSTVQMALDMKARAIICFTTSGRTAPLLSKYFPIMPVLVVSSDQHILRGCRAQFGLHGVPLDFTQYEVLLLCPRPCMHARSSAELRLSMPAAHVLLASLLGNVAVRPA
jgi:pyruvate kinase